MTQYFVDAEGKFLGGFDGGTDANGNPKPHPNVPQGAIEVGAPPPHGNAIFKNGKWAHPAPDGQGGPQPTDRGQDLKILKSRAQQVAGDASLPAALRDAITLIVKLLD